MAHLAIIGSIGWQEIMIILLIGLLLFGSRLPEVGRSLGRGLLEFKKGLRGFQDQMTDLERQADQRIDQDLERRRLEQRSAEKPAESAEPAAAEDLTSATVPREKDDEHPPSAT